MLIFFWFQSAFSWAGPTKSRTVNVDTEQRIVRLF